MQNFSAEWTGWRTFKILLTSLIALLFIFFLYFWNLGTLTPGLSQHEATARSQSSYLNTIKNNPINAPHKLLQYFFHFTGHHGAFWMRSVSVLFALAFVAGFFILARKWFGNTIGLVSTVAFASLPWTIILARCAAPDIMYFTPIVVLLSYTLLCSSKQKQPLIWFAFVCLSAFAIYTPGVIWLVLIGSVVCRKKLTKIITELPKTYVAAGFALFLFLLLPLLISTYFHHDVLKDLLLIPDHFSSLRTVLTSIAWMASTLFVKAHTNSDYIVGRLAILIILQTVLGAIGLYALFKSNVRRALFTLFSCLASIIFAGINGNIVLLCFGVLAVVFLNAVALRFLCIKWFRVFPLNPLPRTFATILIILLITSQVAFGIRYSLYAWPHTPSTRHSYVIK
jgi:hypothetical protein